MAEEFRFDDLDLRIEPATHDGKGDADNVTVQTLFCEKSACCTATCCNASCLC
jgi:hypothetical protein